MITVNLTEIEMLTMLSALNSHAELEINEVDKMLCKRLDKKLREEIARYFTKKKEKKNGKQCI